MNARSDQPFPALVLPADRRFAGYKVAAFARGAELIVADVEAHAAHEKFFYHARQWSPAHRDLYLLVRGEEAMTWPQLTPEAPYKHPLPLIPANVRRDQAALAQRKADSPLKPKKPQEPRDLGMFSDSSSQFDLVTLANTARKS